jgi:hypothetical protein
MMINDRIKMRRRRSTNKDNDDKSWNKDEEEKHQ